MFTGIIETQAKVEALINEQSNVKIIFSSGITAELKIDQSVAHNGVCLTVTEIDQNKYAVVAIKETLDRSNIGSLKVGDLVNLERCMSVNSRFDGHIVQGHVDTTAICIQIKDMNGSTEFVFEYKDADKYVTVEKGSITINGVSLTVVQSGTGFISVCIIPYTLEHTNFSSLKTGDTVNLEFDIVGKYVSRLLNR